MLAKPSLLLTRLLDRLEKMPVIDCHEHLAGPYAGLDTYKEPIAFLSLMYMVNDLWSAGASNQEIELIQDQETPTDEKWPVFSRLWSATQHTAYARVTKLVLEQEYGIKELDRPALDKVAERLAGRNSASYLRILEQAHIKAVIIDGLTPPKKDRQAIYSGNSVLKRFLNKQFPLPANWHPAFPLPYFHEIRRRDFLDYVTGLTGRSITRLKDYEEALLELIKKSVQLGVIALKDQSAYRRVIQYDLPPRSEAERIFNKLLMDPQNQLAWPEAKPLDDYLFHQCMCFAQELKLPVQIHTGHLAYTGNRVDKTNAAHFASILELYTSVRFDLFHANWPYMGDVLFLGKNYNNVALNACWVAMIDPLYTVDFFKRALTTLPHVKIHAFGGDYREGPEFVAAHLALAKEVIAVALSDLVESGWLEEEQAVTVAADWLYNNPNRFYNLGLEPYHI
jgi:predicted TIM-barrel fold metal-dependent hydrolase